MALVFWLTFGVIGAVLSDWMTLGIDALTGLVDGALTAYGINPVVHSPGHRRHFRRCGQRAQLPAHHRNAVLLPLHSWRIPATWLVWPFVMDKLLRRIGLSGRSFVPMLIGFGCSVPAIMATRTCPVTGTGG